MKSKRKHILAAVVLLLAVCGSVVCVKAFVPPVDACRDVVENIKFSDDETIQYTGVEEYGDYKALVFESDIADYEIDAKSKKVCEMSRYDIVSDSFSISQEEAKEKAAGYAEKYRPDIKLEKMVLTSEKQYSSSYEFEWKTIVDNFETGSYFVVEVSGDGKLIGLMCSDRDTDVPDLSKVTVDKQQAEAIALGCFTERYIEMKESRLIVRDGKVVWEVALVVYDTPDNTGEMAGRVIFIDSETGEIVEIW